MSPIPGISTHRLLALLGVLAIATGTVAGVAVAGALALVVLVREVERLRLRTADRHVASDVDALHPALALVATPGVPGDATR